VSLNKIASRYAVAFANFIEKESGNIQQRVVQEFATIAEIINQPSLSKVFANPLLADVEKLQLISEGMASMPVASQTASCLRVLAEGRRFNALPLVAEKLAQAIYASKNSSTAVVTSAKPITEETLALIRQGMESLLKCHLEVVSKLDPTIIGGFVVRVGNKLVDMSISTRVRQITHHVVE
jgi:F-type H+-transporting ATPase subunit delta